MWAAVTALLVIGGALAAIFGAKAVARSDADKARLGFHLATAEIASTLKLAIQHEEDLVVSASAYVTGNPHSSAADFDRWAESVHAMQRYPELLDIGLVTLVPASRLRAFQAHMAAHPLRPLGPNTLLPPETGRNPAGGEPALLLPGRGRPDAERQDLPSRRTGLLRAGANARRGTRQRRAQLRAVHGNR